MDIDRLSVIIYKEKEMARSYVFLTGSPISYLYFAATQN